MLSTEQTNNPIGFWAEKLGIKLNYRPLAPPGKQYCDCDNPLHGGCTIHVKLGIKYCEWCELGCQKRKHSFGNTGGLV